ncbi:sialidase-3 isoform X2 [Clupea harengus]|uniref:exo-alpha-sialidase n=1 Tax=Clupea harengus TaxID=7950 RepID=A0A6P8FVY3_CLUHA|nr:sialidase-3 isoform X2 [Clupea harengus]
MHANQRAMACAYILRPTQDDCVMNREKRTSSCDHDAKLLVMRRGTLDNTTIEWLPIQDLKTACLPEHRTMNPCPVFEKNTQSLFLFFICVLKKTTEHHQICTGKNRARLCYVTSSDYGQSWSDVKDLTESVIGKSIRKWATFAVGPGHGIQTKSGRLIIPAYVFYIHHKCFCYPLPCSVQPYALSFYSDDCGKTWQVGTRMQMKSCECEMAEVMDHEGRSYLYCNARNTSGHRVEAISEDNGVDFTRAHLARNLVEQPHGCQGSVVAFKVPTYVSEVSGEGMWLLYTHPTDRRKRRDLGVYLNRSPLRTSKWEEPWIIHQGPSGYTDLAYCEDKDVFACLMECGEESELEEIACCLFDLRNIMET